MRRTIVALIVAGLVLVAGPAGAKRGGAPCPNGLGTNTYRCSVTAEDGGSFVDCYRFGPAGGVSSKFEMYSDRLAQGIGCACQAGGSPKKRTLNVGTAFTCTSDVGVTFQGTVKRNGITKGAVTNAQGSSWAFACSREDSCTPQ